MFWDSEYTAKYMLNILRMWSDFSQEFTDQCEDSFQKINGVYMVGYTDGFKAAKKESSIDDSS